MIPPLAGPGPSLLSQLSAPMSVLSSDYPSCYWLSQSQSTSSSTGANETISCSDRSCYPSAIATSPFLAEISQRFRSKSAICRRLSHVVHSESRTLHVRKDLFRTIIEESAIKKLPINAHRATMTNVALLALGSYQYDIPTHQLCSFEASNSPKLTRSAGRGSARFSNYGKPLSTGPTRMWCCCRATGSATRCASSVRSR